MKKIILIFALLSISNYGWTRTYQTVIDQVRIDLKDTGPSSSEYRYTDADIVRAINFIEEEIVSYTLCLEARYSTTTVVDQREYALPSDILGVPLRVAYYNTSDTSTFKRLEFYSIAGLDTRVSTWEAISSGLPRRYYLRVNKIGLDPSPSVSYSTTSWNCLRIDYLLDPTDITTSTTSLATVPFNDHQHLSAFHKVIVAGVKAMLTGFNTLNERYYALLIKMAEEVQARPDQFKGQKSFR